MTQTTPENSFRFRKPLYLLSALVLALAICFHFGEDRGTVAISSDKEKSEGNTFTAWNGEDDPAPAPIILPARLDHLVISEVLYDDTSGDDAGKEWIELYNGTSGEVDMSGMNLYATTGDDFVFPSGFKLSQFSFVVVHWNTAGTDLGNNLYTGTPSGFDNMGNTSGWVALFKDSTHTKDSIVDYVEYGAGGQTAESKAVDAGIWTAGAFIPDVPEGHSIEKKEKDVDTNLATEFKDQATPTPGT